MTDLITRLSAHATLEEALPCTCIVRDGHHYPDCDARLRPAIDQLRAADQARIAELEDMLATALPYVESAEADPAYKTGAVSKVVARIRAALTCKTCGGTKRVPDETERGSTDFDPNYLVPCPTCGGSDE